MAVPLAGTHRWWAVALGDSVPSVLNGSFVWQGLGEPVFTALGLRVHGECLHSLKTSASCPGLEEQAKGDR